MLIYQKWYNAAARMMTAMDDMLDRVINGMGRVGL
jgi:flagellar hook-associated protein 1 FlgK